MKNYIIDGNYTLRIWKWASVVMWFGMLLAGASSALAQKDYYIWDANLVPCNLVICGKFPQNIATLTLTNGSIAVARSGLVTITLKDLRNLSTGQIMANKTLDVFFGSFTSFVSEFPQLGVITTDENGNFNGTINTRGGAPFVFALGTIFSGQFVLNDPGIRSEFITGFSVPMPEARP
jgi:hypothetical protein